MRSKIEDFINKKYTYFILASIFLLLLPNCIKVLSANYLSGLIYRGIILALFGILAAMSFVFNKQYKTKYFTIFISTYLAFSIISLCLTKAKLNLKLETLDCLLSIGEICSTIISFIFIFSCLKTHEINKLLIVKTLAYASIVLIFLSFIIDWNAIVNTFTEFDHSNYDVKSIFFDKNTFGLFLFAGCTSFCFLGITKNRFYLFGAVFSVLYSGIARAKTSLLISLIVLIGSFVYCVVYDVKSKKNKNILIYFSLIFLVMITLVLIISKVGFFAKIFDVIFGDYGLIYDGKVVIRERFKNWSNKLSSIDSPLIWIFGYGERLAYTFAGRPIDNSYIYILLNGGLTKLILYIAILGYLVFHKTKISTSKINKVIGVVSIFSVVLYGLFEDCYLIGCSLPSLLFSLIIVCI